MVADASVVPINPPLEVKPVRDWILLKERARGKTPQGIIIPETANSPRLAAWEVVSVGPGIYQDGSLVPMSVKPGDAVAIQPAFAIRAPIEGHPHAMVRDEAIMAVIVGDSFGRAGMIESPDGFIE